MTNHGACSASRSQFTLLGSDPDTGTVLTYSALGLPEGATLDPQTGAFAWTPGPAQTGDYSVQFSVSDGELIDDRSRSCSAPTISPVLPQVTIELTPSFPAVPGQ